MLQTNKSSGTSANDDVIICSQIGTGGRLNSGCGRGAGGGSCGGGSSGGSRESGSNPSSILGTASPGKDNTILAETIIVVLKGRRRAGNISNW